VVEQAIAEAARLAAEQQRAVADLAAAEDALDRAMTEQRAAESATLDATAAAREVRDRLAVLGPPPLGGDGPAAAWDGLLAWVTERKQLLAAERATAAAAHDVARDHLARLDDAARDLVRRVTDSRDGRDAAADRPLSSLRDELAQADTAAAAAITSFDESRARLDELAARVAEQDERAEVAEQLAYQLRTDRFEAWLRGAALSELVDAASVRLRELTSGQFSLALVDQAFMVHDHANADELRGARTLSGGETFLASLSLALALADATSELAPEGAPTLESIFLDEGFGSLDPATLDTVAAAIEELGSAGRMVVVVTHIRELAERLPVRLEVTKSPASATVERIDA
jgi:DNA repair protein SbcC/Rad50